MIFKRKTWCGRRLVWHQWFAWYPARLDEERLVWWQTISRRGVVAAWDWKWEYKLND